MTPNTKTAEQEALEIYHALLLPETYDEKKESMATLASLISDKRRLDWLEENRAGVNHLTAVSALHQKPHCWIHGPCDEPEHFCGDTYREAIDQAMKERQS